MNQDLIFTFHLYHRRPLKTHPQRTGHHWLHLHGDFVSWLQFEELDLITDNTHSNKIIEIKLHFDDFCQQGYQQQHHRLLNHLVICHIYFIVDPMLMIFPNPRWCSRTGRKSLVWRQDWIKSRRSVIKCVDHNLLPK